MLTKQRADDILRTYGGLNRRLGRFALRPILYFLYITARCNLRCSYCWQRAAPPEADRGRRGGPELSADEWRRVVERLPRPGAVGFSGGEPLLVEGFDEIFTRAADRRAVTVNSNGALLTEQISRLFVDKGLRNLSVSLDGFRQIHDAWRQSPGLFDRVVGNLDTFNDLRRLAAGRRPALTIKTTLVDDGVAGLADFCDYCDRELRADTVNISLVKTETHAQFSHRLYDRFADLRSPGTPRGAHYRDHARVAEALTGLLDRYARGRMRITVYPDMRTRRQIRDYLAADGKDVYRRCHVPWAMVAVMAGGDVIPCLSLPLGNLRDADYDIRDILSAKTNREFRRTLAQLQRGGHTPDVCNCCCFLRVR